jgi:hypothetical protein
MKKQKQRCMLNGRGRKAYLENVCIPLEDIISPHFMTQEKYTYTSFCLYWP